MPRILALGTFDLPHAGHASFLERCAMFGELWVALNTDEFAARYKRPTICSLEERRKVVSAWRFVDHVIVNEGCEDAKPAILKAMPDAIAHGDDWQGDSLMAQLQVSRDWLRERKIAMLYVPYTQGVSSTEIVRRIESRSFGNSAAHRGDFLDVRAA